MTAETFFNLLLASGLFLAVLGFGSYATWQDIVYLWRQPILLVRSALAMYVVMPVVTLVLLAVLPLPRPTQVALVLLAIAPGLPAAPKSMLKLGGNPSYVHSLMVNTSLLALVTVPISLAILSAVFPEEVSIQPLQVLTAISPSFLVPMALGLGLRHWLPAVAERIGQIAPKIGGVMLITWWVVLVVLNFPAILDLGVFSLGALALWVLVGLAVGHLLGGPDSVNRPALASILALRHIGVPAIIATTCIPGASPLPMILAYVTAYNFVPILYANWLKRLTAARVGELEKEPNKGTPSEHPSTATETKS